MKRFIILFLVILFNMSLVSCVGLRTNFKYPNDYGKSTWVANENDIDIMIAVDSNNVSFGFITFEEITKKYKIIFAVDGMSFRCLNDNDEYILEDETFMLQEKYDNDFPNVSCNVKESSFIITKTKDKLLECYITYKALNYIFPYSDNESENDRVYFVFNMVNE